MSNITESQIRNEAERHLLLCRPGDWNHAQRVVFWVKELGGDREDILLIITAGYIHDIGWEGLVTKEKITLDELLELEDSANKNSKSFATNFLKDLHFSSENIDTINRLIRAADKHQSSQEDEAIIVDADSLSKLTIDHLKEKFEKSEWMKMYGLWAGKFLERVKTEKAKSLYPKLLAELKDSIEKEL
ncbi:HD domain-containing protein [Candidatus Nomurabacteria bacterium]|nr:HD domain-containing protein [Candidatus Nomurabacteria bacterium]